MKKNFLPLIIAMISTTGAYAQEKNAPRTEFNVELSASAVEISPGETKELTVSLLRSKAYAKSKAKLNLSSGLPDGITISFEPAEGFIGSSVAKITADENTKEGTYLIVLNAEMQSKRKGTTLKLLVGKDTVSSRN